MRWSLLATVALTTFILLSGPVQADQGREQVLLMLEFRERLARATSEKQVNDILAELPNSEPALDYDNETRVLNGAEAQKELLDPFNDDIIFETIKDVKELTEFNFRQSKKRYSITDAFLAAKDAEEAFVDRLYAFAQANPGFTRDERRRYAFDLFAEMSAAGKFEPKETSTE